MRTTSYNQNLNNVVRMTLAVLFNPTCSTKSRYSNVHAGTRLQYDAFAGSAALYGSVNLVGDAYT